MSLHRTLRILVAFSVGVSILLLAINCELTSCFSALNSDILDSDCPSTRLGMLVWLGKALDSHRIPWFVSHGTLLGAVAEGTILPWTSDVDIVIPWGLASINKNVFHSFLVSTERCFSNNTAHRTSTYERFFDSQPIMKLHGRHGTEHVKEYWFWYSKPVYVDLYNMFDWQGIADLGVHNYKDEEGRSLPGLYLVGSCLAKKSDRRLSRSAVFPINKTGVRIGHHVFPTPNIPQAFLDLQYGPLWCFPPPWHSKFGSISGCKKDPNDFESQGPLRRDDLGPCDEWKMANADSSDTGLGAVLADRQLQKGYLAALAV